MTTPAILIVEDQRLIAKGIANQVKSMGYLVAGSASTGEDAVRQALELRPDLILMDISLGAGIDGVEAARLIRRELKVPVVYLTANADDEVLRRAIGSNPFGYVRKPYDDGELRTAIDIGLYRHSMECRLRESEQWLAATLSSIGEAVVATDGRGVVRFMNAEAERLTGWSSEEALGHSLAEVNPLLDATGGTASDLTALAVESARTVQLPANCVLITRSGDEVAVNGCIAPIRDWDGGVTGLVMVCRDVSASRTMTMQLAHLAHYDFLTGLPNRLLLADRLTQAMATARRHGQKIAVLFLDLDGFKGINDALGHAVGDRLLQSVAKRLLSCVRDSDTVSRLGGDEFIVLLTEMRVDYAEGTLVAVHRLLAAVAEDHAIEGHALQLTTSLGVSIYPDDGLDVDTLIGNADAAMYQAKKNGRRGYRFFEPAIQTRPAIEAKDP